MLARPILLVAMAATQLPSQASAQQRGFIGITGGASHVSTDSYGVRADNRASFGARAGYGWPRIKIVLDYQRHGLGDEQPSPSDWPLGTVEPARIPQILETEFLLLGAQILLTRGLYVRPALGVGRRAFAAYVSTGGVTIDSASVTKEGGPAASAGLGYLLKLHPRFSLAIEASGLVTTSVEGEQTSTVFGIQVSPLLEF